MPFELFISYSRKDNVPQKAGDPTGWVTALHAEILADHRRFSTEPLRIFFDTSEIKDMNDWRHRILEGLRDSRILLVCLSPDYFKSDYCRWELEEYIQRQVHQLMGFDSFAQVYFVEVPGVAEQDMARGWYELLRRTNYTDLRPWFPHGTEALREAAVREKIASLGTSLWERIQRARRATGVPGNLRRLNPHFIGRRTELRQLHENLALGAVGVVTTREGPEKFPASRQKSLAFIAVDALTEDDAARLIEDHQIETNGQWPAATAAADAAAREIARELGGFTLAVESVANLPRPAPGISPGGLPPRPACRGVARCG
jgi:hypothetical protein